MKEIVCKRETRKMNIREGEFCPLKGKGCEFASHCEASPVDTKCSIWGTTLIPQQTRTQLITNKETERQLDDFAYRWVRYNRR